MGSQFQLRPQKGLVFGEMHAKNALQSAGPTEESGSSEQESQRSDNPADLS